MKTGYPVQDFPMQFSWQEGDWELLFDQQIKLIKEDIARAKVQERMILYLSCPISGRGGSYSGTNVEITEFTRMRLLKKWGTQFWILNPANYQMESKGGLGLMHRHAQTLWENKLGSDGAEKRLNDLVKKSPPTGGDYLRMWTKVLVEDSGQNLGYNFDAFYFLGPSDVQDYFLNSADCDLTSSIQNYFASKYALDSDFRDNYSVKGINWGVENDSNGNVIVRTPEQQALIDKWNVERIDFFRFYSLKCSINFSAGSHDEWNIWNLLNKKRMEFFTSKNDWIDGVGELLPGYFDGRQLTPADFKVNAYLGYEVET